MKKDCLYQYDDDCIGIRDFIGAYEKLGIMRGNTIFVHADLSVFGRFGPQASKDELCSFILKAIEAAIPGGTLAVPTFTYSFCQGTPFDIENSPGEQMSLFSEFFRRQKGVIRSQHPIVSVAARGPKAHELLNVDMDAYGEHSFFANLRRVGGIVVFLGAPFDRATMIHHIEQLFGVPYRYAKIFSGIARSDGNKREVSCTYQVLPLGVGSPYDLSTFKARLLKEGAMKEVQVGAGYVSAVRATDMFRAGQEMLREDVTAFLTKPLAAKIEERLVV